LESWCFLPQGWSEDFKADYSATECAHTDGSKQDQHPGKPEGIIALANAIPDVGALSSANLLMNNIGTEQAHPSPCHHPQGAPHPKSLCGNKGNETELDMSGKNMRAGGAIMLALEITDNRAMTGLNLASNNLRAGLPRPRRRPSRWLCVHL
jgi:hypothetical protein